VSQRLDEAVAELNAFGPDDFDMGSPTADGMERLRGLCDEILLLEDGPTSAPAMFALMERLDGADLGSPGPLVHTLEKWRDVYPPLLQESMRRKPSALSVWMVNRILNSNPPDAQTWLTLLREAVSHPAASATAQEDAREFLEYQANR
jgi:hypothetical protein